MLLLVVVMASVARLVPMPRGPSASTRSSARAPASIAWSFVYVCVWNDEVSTIL